MFIIHKMCDYTFVTEKKRSDLTSIIENLRNQKFIGVRDKKPPQRDEATVFPVTMDTVNSPIVLADNTNSLSDSDDLNLERRASTMNAEDTSSVCCVSAKIESASTVEDTSTAMSANELLQDTSTSALSSGSAESQLMLLKECYQQSFDKLNQVESTRSKYGETTVSTEPIDISSQIQVSLKSSRKKRMDRTILANSTTTPDYSMNNNNSIINNNNNVKNERLSPGTPDTSSRSRSVTPSSASHPGTPPATDSPMIPGGRNYSDFMRSLAAKYNNANPNDYFSAARNGFAPPLDSRFKPASFPMMSNMTSTPSNNKENDLASRKPDFSSILNPFVNTPLFPPLIDMSSTQTLLAMVRTAKENELQGLLKNIKRTETSTPLDLSAAGPPLKKLKTKHPTSSSPSGGLILPKRPKSESPNLGDDIKSWTVDDVCNFVSSIDICAEYVQNFRDQRIDGSGLPLLTEEHLTSTISMKLGPALKLKSILAKKLGSCNICLHCAHCHNSASPEPATTTGNSSDSGGAS